ncbi:transketolase family protein [Helcococcus kunzii]|uniref:Transketolase-like pyrimidine-binding domain-containing protein n=1 Tax=Helcococcus kunzii ATCC 51366 TaxID=883114 RepID=H3NL88_9FIRM|nr:transketolase C-terminal domain-containing protein [Helcococcus kunzii]EHR36069.1 hypothetical protein HMPREF9709_00165 [Helcococcus kunzii ATCC 51366]
MNNIPNSKMMCNVLIESAKKDKNILVLTSDSRGSGKLADFADAFPENIIEVGIAEQNIVSIGAGLAHSGKRAFVVSPAAFLSMRSIEQVKVDVAYSETNVKLVGISGGVSYGALGMTHHSLQDFAVTRAIPNLRVYCPADQVETKKLFEQLVKDDKPAYIRLGRNAVPICYDENYSFEIDKATIITEGKDILLIGIGECLNEVIKAGKYLEEDGISSTILGIHSIKPLDTKTILKYSKEIKNVISVEEHSIYGGLGSAIAEILSEEIGIKQRIIGLPDEALVTGNSKEIFHHYGLDAKSIYESAKDLLSGK